MNLSGLSAVYPGYSAQEALTAKTEGVRANTDSTRVETQANEMNAREAAIKMLGANVLGASLGGQRGPQAPPPGQASVPNSPPPAPPAAIPPQGAPGVPQGGPPAAPQPPAAAQPPAAGGAPVAGGKMGLQPMIARILQTTPGVANHPEILLSALNHAKDMGILDLEAEAKIDETNKMHTAARIDATKGHTKAAQAPEPAAAQPSAFDKGAAPVASMPTATDPKTGARVQWNGTTWQPLTT